MVVISMQNRFPNPIPYSFGKWEKPKKVICIASEIRKSLQESDDTLNLDEDAGAYLARLALCLTKPLPIAPAALSACE